MILLLYLDQFYKTEQGVGSSPNRNSCCIVSSRLSILLLCFDRINRTCLRDELYATGKMKEEIRGEPCEDDLMLSTRAEAKFVHHLQLGDAVFHSQAYRGITRRNHHTDAYAQGGDTRYQQTEVFQLRSVELSLLKCSKVRNILPIQYHATLGFPINHIVPISKSKQAIFATLIFNFSVLSQLTLID